MLRLVAGQVQMQFPSMPAAIQHVQTGRLRMIAQTGKQRSPAALRIMLSQHAAVTRIQILKCRGGRPGIVDLERPLLAPPVRSLKARQ